MLTPPVQSMGGGPLHDPAAVPRQGAGPEPPRGPPRLTPPHVPGSAPAPAQGPCPGMLLRPAPSHQPAGARAGRLWVTPPALLVRKMLLALNISNQKKKKKSMFNKYI